MNKLTDFIRWRKKVILNSIEMNDWKSFKEVYFSSPFSTFLVATNFDGKIVGCVALRNPHEIVASIIHQFKLSPSSVLITVS